MPATLLRYCTLTLLVALVASGCGPSRAAETTSTVAVPQRVPWTTSHVRGMPGTPPPYRCERVFPNIEFDQPVTITNVPGTDRLIVMQLMGQLYTFSTTGEPEKQLFLDMRESGLPLYRAYGMTFSPDYAHDHYVYLCYVTANREDDASLVTRMKVSGDPPVADPKSEEVLFRWGSGGHNGACIKFGPDGMLYIGTGDGSDPSPPDVRNSGQDISDLYASILRIDVNHPDPGKKYSIPKDNPFVDVEGARGEVWAYGIRQPWKMSFDEQGHLWVGEIGWELWEMVYDIQKGGNYGWSIMEGPQPIKPEGKRGPSPILTGVVEHPHTEARSLTGGYVYRGNKLPELKGTYIYGDYITGKIWGFRYVDGKAVDHRELADSHRAVIDFGEDNDGELYVMDYGGGIYELKPTPASAYDHEFPQKISETGLFASTPNEEPAAGVIPYSINVEMWNDGGIGERWLGIPDSGQIKLDTKKDLWNWPENSVLAKTISVETEPGNATSRKRVETQIMHWDGFVWNGYTYAWNDEQTDAELVAAEGADRLLTIADDRMPGGQRQQTWHYSSRADCVLCHNPRPRYGPGFNPWQLDRMHDYGAGPVNERQALEKIGIFDQPYTVDEKYAAQVFEHFPDARDPSAPTEALARAYMQVNCAHCHLRGGGGTAPFELRYNMPRESMGIVDVRASLGTFGIPRAHVVASGDPLRSVLYYRMSTVGLGRMPHIGSTVVDENGLALMRRWINELSPPAGSLAPAALEVEPVLAQLKQSADAAERATLIAQLLSATPSSLALQLAVEQHDLPEAVEPEVIRAGVTHANPAISGLFERFIPESERIKRLGANVKPAEILAYRGNAEHGRHLFFEVEGVRCKNCHKIQGKGGDVGTDLSEIGKKNDRAAILESLLEPSKKIDPKFVPYLCETSDGLVYTGLLVSQNDQEIVLKDAQSKLVRIAADNVEVLVPQQKSLMPELLFRDMTAQDVADLLEFLSEQK